MGSGLILLLIVGAWLAVLVPMALRSSDPGTSAPASERVAGAVRVLARRPGGRGALSRRLGLMDDAEDVGAVAVDRLDVDTPDVDAEHVGAGDDVGVAHQVARAGVAPRRGGAALSPVEPMLRSLRLEPRRRLAPARRRRRVLLALLAGAAAGLLGGLVSAWLLGAGVLLLAAAAAYVVHLRTTVVRAQEQQWQEQDSRWPEVWDERDAYPEAASRGAAAVPPVSVVSPQQPLFDQELLAPAGGDAVTGAPPTEPLVLPPVRQEWDERQAPTARTEAALYGRPTPDSGAPWTPIPVPRPLYLSATPAPVRGREQERDRYRDRDAAARWSDGLAGVGLGVGDEPEDDTSDERRAVGDW